MPTKQNQAADIVQQILALNFSEERRAFLDQACQDDLELRRLVKSKLDAMENSMPFDESHSAATIDTHRHHLPDRQDAVHPVSVSGKLNSDEAAVAKTVDFGAANLSGTLIAEGYRLIEQLGKGGMGEVWLAEQKEPVRRHVALKLIKAGMDSREVLARFAAERQALALMNHPNIARILDAGTVADGSPFFVMELVKGQPLTQYCDQNRLEINHRLSLFSDVCSGVQHAHQKGIIHRDLKPSNILVAMIDGQPVPKVIDFGLAKAMESTQRLTDQSLFTRIGQIVGTLKYMSPEQAGTDANDIDTRTDIYSLGAILYELLTGWTPLDDKSIKDHAVLKVLELIRDKEPVKPSSRLSSSDQSTLSEITSRRRTDSGRLNRVLAGDLDWIVMKALEKDRTRRYESASGFAADIQRYLHDEPVIARPPSVNYRMRKFVRKHRTATIAAGLLVGALALGMAGTTWGLFRAMKAERLASDRYREAEQARVDADTARQAEARRAVSERQAKLAAQQASEKEREARHLAEDETRAKETALRKEELERKYAEAIADFVKNDFLALTSVEGQFRFDVQETIGLGKDTTLRQLLDRAAEKLKLRQDLDPRIAAELYWIIGVSYRSNGDHAQAISFLEKSLKLHEDVLGTDDPNTLTCANSLAVAYYTAGQLDKALPLYEQTVQFSRAKLGPDHPDTLASMNNLAAAYREIGAPDKAFPLWQQTLDLMKAKLGPDHPVTLLSMSGMATAYRDMGQFDKALALNEQTLALRQAKLGLDHPHTLNSMHNLAAAYRDVGQLDKALALNEQTLELRKAKLGLDHPDTLNSMRNLAGDYHDTGQIDRALPLYEQALELAKARLGPDHPSTLTSMSNLAVGYWRKGQLDKSIPLFEEVLQRRERKFGRSHPDTLLTIGNLGVNYRDSGRLSEAIPLLEEATSAVSNYPRLDGVQNELRKAYLRAKRIAEFGGMVDKQLFEARQRLVDNPPELASLLASISSELLQIGDYPKAEVLLVECVEIRQQTTPDTWTTFNAQSMLGGAILEQAIQLMNSQKETVTEPEVNQHATARKLADALPLLVAGYEGMKQRADQIPPDARIRLTEAVDRLIEHAAATNNTAELKKWQAERATYGPRSAD